MADVGAISHNPSLSSQVRGGWRKLGENVGRGGSVDVLHQAFVNSPGHYANLVDPAFTHIGVGVVERNGTLWTAHVFMAAAGGGAPPVASPPSASAPAPRASAPSLPSRRSGAPLPRRVPAASGGGGGGGGPTPVAAPAPPPPPPPEPTALPSLLVDLRQLDRRS
jgi:hypothetical protein